MSYHDTDLNAHELRQYASDVARTLRERATPLDFSEGRGGAELRFWVVVGRMMEGYHHVGSHMVCEGYAILLEPNGNLLQGEGLGDEDPRDWDYTDIKDMKDDQVLRYDFHPGGWGDIRQDGFIRRREWQQSHAWNVDAKGDGLRKALRNLRDSGAPEFRGARLKRNEVASPSIKPYSGDLRTRVPTKPQPGGSSRRWPWLLVATLVVALLLAWISDDSGSSNGRTGPDRSQTGGQAEKVSASPRRTSGQLNTKQEEGPNQFLHRTQQMDGKFIEDRLLGRWVPQIASGQSGTEVQGTTLTLTALVKRHERLVKRYGALLLNSSDYVYEAQGFWVSVAPVGFDTARDALAWCIGHGQGPKSCYAKLLTHDASIDTTNVYLP